VMGPVEVLHTTASAKNARVGLFDFDGTLSLIRSGWAEVMRHPRITNGAGRLGRAHTCRQKASARMRHPPR